MCSFLLLSLHFKKNCPLLFSLELEGEKDLGGWGWREHEGEEEKQSVAAAPLK